MLDDTTNPTLRKPPDLLLRLLSTIGSKIFRADDCYAREHGWQISPRHGGLSRAYRDPRFDSLISCAACNGRGFRPDRTTCPDCGGSGRLDLDQTGTTPGRGQQGQGERS
jgi:hypothetical protein